MNEMSIGEFAKKTRVNPSTLRYYERIGILSPQGRVNGQRRYGRESLKRMSIIGVAKEAGFSLLEIRTLLDGLSNELAPSERWKDMALKKLPEVEALIVRAQGMKRLLTEGLDCECLSVDACLLLVGRGPESESMPPAAG